MTPTRDLQHEAREILAQAAVWVTDLHGPDRNAELEAGVRRWLAEDPRHAQAFERATDAWQCSGDLLARPPLPQTAALPSRRSTRSRLVWAGAAALALILALSFYLLESPALITGAAEQKTVELSDGTQVRLNANSRIVVAYTDNTRSVTLTQGEAYFDVAKIAARPFVVTIGSRKVIALGTAFEVRREDGRSDDFSVTLIDGHVAIEPVSGPNQIPTASTLMLPNPAAQPVTLLDPGQRLRISAGVPDTLDTPPMERITAWQRGQLIFEDTSLREAAAEFNRYGKHRLIIDDSVPQTLHVGGVFRIGDPASFAQAMSNAYQLRLIEHNQEIILSKP